ncbi:MAG: hypothetical protein ACYDGR_09820 [Candidatus Dormibacteria bacterium]
MRTRVFYRKDEAPKMNGGEVSADDYDYVGEFDTISNDDCVMSLMNPLMAAVVLDVERGIQPGDVIYREDLYHVVLAEGFKRVLPGAETTKLYRQVLAAYERMGVEREV